ncbi:MAG: hypothetical protein Q9162_001359 [Coniocarpon cinnabarinum]
MTKFPVKIESAPDHTGEEKALSSQRRRQSNSLDEWLNTLTYKAFLTLRRGGPGKGEAKGMRPDVDLLE